MSAPGGKSNCGAKVNCSGFAALDARRREMGVPVKCMLVAAGVAPRTWDYMRAGAVTPQRRTLVKLSRALDRLSRGAPVAPPPSMIAAAWRACVLYLAGELGADPARALDARGPSCPLDPAWLVAARARQLALYLVHVELCASFSALAAAIGSSKQRVQKAVRRVEDLRDAPDTDALLSRTTAFLTGRVFA